MSIEHDLSALLSDRAERIRIDGTRREEVLKRARRGRSLVMATVVLGAASVLVVGLSVAGSLPDETPYPAPVDRPTEHQDSDVEEVPTDVFITEASDGSWTLFGGISHDGKVLCLSLEGTGCVSATSRASFILLGSFDDLEKRGFIYGPVDADVAALELVIDERVIPLRLREFPDRLRVTGLRFFVRAVKGERSGVIVARDRTGRVLQEMDVSWGMLDP
ncbi:MAG TPA: hypothetical protein VG929_09790 [Actinomycetota bacterium]|nr:hypothetical protein [Actinomycetota bacterium]